MAASPTICAMAALAVLAAASGAAADKGQQPVVVELFQSQGCSSCPPANANLNALADRPDLLALSFGVTYWDQLGWKDTFARPEYTARQWDYAHGLHNGNVGTPQMVLNGRSETVGVDRPALEASIRGAGSPSTVAVAITGAEVAIGAAASPGKPADVWLMRYDPRVQEVPIRRGENGGRTLPHRNIVRQMVRLGAWTGPAVRYTLPATTDPALKTAVLVQTRGGPVLGAAKG